MDLSVYIPNQMIIIFSSANWEFLSRSLGKTMDVLLSLQYKEMVIHKSRNKMIQTS